jgi:hypothetical protein
MQGLEQLTAWLEANLEDVLEAVDRRRPDASVVTRG